MSICFILISSLNSWAGSCGSTSMENLSPESELYAELEKTKELLGDELYSKLKQAPKGRHYSGFIYEIDEDKCYLYNFYN